MRKRQKNLVAKVIAELQRVETLELRHRASANIIKVQREAVVAALKDAKNKQEMTSALRLLTTIYREHSWLQYA